MKALITTLSATLALTATSLLLAQERQRVSPHETVTANVAGNNIKVVYGRPYTKDPKSGEKRTVWGGLVPYGKVWRMGADEATLFTTEKDIKMGDTTIPAGTYSLYMLPQEDGARLIINKQTGQWGTKYDEAQDLARVPLKKEALREPVDQLTIAITDTDAGGVLKIMWEDAQYSVGFKAWK
jgi:hypothetical protein